MKNAALTAKFYKIFFLLTFISCYVIVGCNSNNNADTGVTPEVKTPVTVTSISYDPINEYIELNATSSFLQKSYVKANLNGYVKKVYIKVNDFTNSGQRLFVLKTKEAYLLYSRSLMLCVQQQICLYFN